MRKLPWNYLPRDLKLWPWMCIKFRQKTYTNTAKTSFTINTKQFECLNECFVWIYCKSQMCLIIKLTWLKVIQMFPCGFQFVQCDALISQYTYLPSDLIAWMATFAYTHTKYEMIRSSVTRNERYWVFSVGRIEWNGIEKKITRKETTTKRETTVWFV